MVGRLTDDVESDDAAAYVSGATDAALTSDAQAVLLRAWYAAPEEMAYFDALNEASTTAFLNHAAKLEGLQDSSEVLKRGRWRHLPHWIESYWLPVRSDRATDGPVFFGSAYGLLANLVDIAAASPQGLGTIPEHFELMRANPKAFYALELDALDEATMLQWVWRAHSRQPPFPSSETFLCGAARTTWPAPSI